MAVVRIEDRASATEWNGTLIAEEITRKPDDLRWAELRIYALDDGGWLLYRLGMSRVYHTADTTCTTHTGKQSGDVATLEDLPDDAEPCPVCQPAPPLDLIYDEQVRFEYPRHKPKRFGTPGEVVSALITVYWQGEESRVLSEPVARLLVQAARHDPAFGEKPVKRIA